MPGAPKGLQSASPHPDLSPWKAKMHQASSILYPPQKDAHAGRANWAGQKKQQHQALGADPNINNVPCKPGTLTHLACLSSSERKTVITNFLNFLINHSSFLSQYGENAPHSEEKFVLEGMGISLPTGNI